MPGFLSGPVSLTRFSCDPSSPSRQQVLDRLTEYAFRSPSKPLPDETAHGFVLYDNMLDVGFADLERWAIDPYIVLGLRIDSFKLPPAESKARLDRACREWCKERGAERVPNAIRKNLRELIAAELKLICKTRLIEIVWQPDLGRMWVGQAPDSAMDVLRKVFFRSFGVKLTYDPLLPLCLADELPLDPSDLLTWLLLRSEKEEGRLGDHEVRLQLLDKVVLGRSSTHETVAVRGAVAPACKETKTALLAKKPVESCQVTVFGQEGGEYVRTGLKASKGRLELIGLRFGDRFGPEGDENPVKARMASIEYFENEVFSRVVESFVAVRVSAKAWAAVQEGLLSFGRDGDDSEKEEPALVDGEELDFLDQMIEDTEAKSPGFKKKVEEAYQRRVLERLRASVVEREAAS